VRERALEHRRETNEPGPQARLHVQQRRRHRQADVAACIGEIDEFLDAVRRVGRGGTATDPEVISQLLGRKRDVGPLDKLTPREREVLELMAQGLSNRGICEKLVVSPKTVETHVSSIFWKLDLLPAQDEQRRVLAVLAYLRA